jgi:hypothetical protein
LNLPFSSAKASAQKSQDASLSSRISSGEESSRLGSTIMQSLVQTT